MCCITTMGTRINMELTGKKIKECRLRKGLSILEVTELLNLASIQSIYQWESGKYLPSLERLHILCKLYDLKSIDDLIVFED